MGDQSPRLKVGKFPPGTVLGYRKDGRAILPIAGGDPTDDANTVNGPQLTHSQAVNRCRELHVEIERLGALDTPTTEEEDLFARSVEEFNTTDAWRRTLERRAAQASVKAVADGPLRTAGTRYGTPGAKIETGSMNTFDRDPIMEPDSVDEGRFRNPWDLRSMNTFDRSGTQVAAEYRARALSAVAQMSGCSDNIRKAGTELIERWDDRDARLSRLTLALSDPEYLTAWSRMAVNPQLPNLEPGEQRAIERVQSAARAMSLTDSAGGYLVPFQLDPTVIITANGSVNQIRQVARQVVAIGDTWNGVSAGAVSWSYDAEGTQVSDDAPTFAQPTIPIYKAAGFVPISIEAIADAANVTTEVGRLLAFGKDVLEAAAFATGTGSGQPTGLITALVASSPTSIVNSATTDTFALADVYALQGALPARYRSMPSTAWMANNLIYNKIRQFDTTGGNGLWETVGNGTPSQLLGRRVIESEDMDGVVNASTENYVAVFGDFENYVIADRIGMTVEFIPHLFSTTNGRPTGSRGWYAYVRHGADAVNDAGFRMLDVT